MKKGFVKFVVLLLAVCMLIPAITSCSKTLPLMNNIGNNINNGIYDSQLHEHTWEEWVIVQEATCLEKGIKQRVCSECQKTEKENIDASGHQYSDWQVTVQNTCITPGNKTVICSICNFRHSEVIPASGHTYGDPIQITVPTCTDKGENEKNCITCGHTEKEEVPATGHNFVNDVCSVCNAVSDDRAVQTVKIINESLLLPLNTPVKLNVQIYPENAIYGEITYTIDERNNTCGATITSEGILSCTQLGSVRIRATVGNVSSSYVTFNVPTEIRTAEEFNAIRNNLKGSYVLCNDIDLSSYDAWTPIGYATKAEDGSLSFTGTGFQGEFNGNGYTISGLNIDLSKTELVTVGLFGFVDTSAIVNNVKISANINGAATISEYIGTLTGVNYGTINNCEVVSAIDMSGALYVGGIVGQNNGKLNNCVSDVEIKASNTNSSGYYVGGIAGQFQIGNMDNNTVKANIEITSCEYGYIGGVTGNTFGSFSGISCEADITVNATSSSSNISYVGGVVGKLEEPQSEIVFDLNDKAVAGSITVNQAGNIYIGGIVGYGDSLKNCINEVEISVTNAQKTYVGGVAGYGKAFDNCYNKANITAASLGTNYIAGIAGQSEKIINSNNYSRITVNSDSTSYVGGVAGATKTLNNVTNYAYIAVAAGSAYFGGVAGKTETAQKAYNYTYELTLTGGGSFGGIIGECDQQLEDAYNTALLSVDGASTELYVGGAIGRADSTDNTIKNAVNTGKIDIDVTRLCIIYIGGIAGKAASIKDSHNASVSISILTDDVSFTYASDAINVGGLCGHSSGIIENCYSYASVKLGKNTSTAILISSYIATVGGLAGKANYILTSYAIGDVDVFIYNDNVFAGGLVGTLTGTASQSYARGSVSGITSKEIRIGGLAGYVESTAKILNCYAAYGLLETNITSNGNLAYVGGLAAESDGTIEDSYAMNYINTIGSGTSDKIYAGGVIGYNNGTVSRCYSESAFEHALNISVYKDIDCTSNLSAEVYVGGFVGYNDKTINNCYAKAEVVGRGCYTGGFVGAQGTDGQIQYSLALAPVNSGIAGQTLTGGFSGATAGTYTGCIFSTTGTGIDATNAAGGSTITGILGKTEAELLVSSVYTEFDNAVWTLADGKIAALTLNDNWKVIDTTYDKFNALINVVNSSVQFAEISDSVVEVKFESNYPIELPNTMEFAKGSCVSSMPTLYEEGYVFCGWYTDAGFTEPFAPDGFYTVNKNLTLYAYFRKKIEKPATETYKYSGEEITLKTVDSTTAKYTTTGTLKATNTGIYSVTLTLGKAYIWLDETTDDYTINWKIVQPVITYNTEKISIKATDTLNAELFSATAVDFVGEGSTMIPVTVEITSGSLTAGTAINVALKTVIDGIETIIPINGIQVYAAPTITYLGQDEFIDADTDISTLFEAKNSFGESLEFTLDTTEGRTQGHAVTVKVSVTDAAGNNTSMEKTLVVRIANYTFVLNDETYTLTKYTGSDENVSIPATVGGKSVTAIASSVFQDNTTMTSVTIPESVTTIGSFAFYSCTSLTTVYYTGTAIKWDAISIGSGNSYLTNATRHYSETSGGEGSSDAPNTPVTPTFSDNLPYSTVAGTDFSDLTGVTDGDMAGSMTLQGGIGDKNDDDMALVIDTSVTTDETAETVTAVNVGTRLTVTNGIGYNATGVNSNTIILQCDYYFPSGHDVIVNVTAPNWTGTCLSDHTSGAHREQHLTLYRITAEGSQLVIPKRDHAGVPTAAVLESANNNLPFNEWFTITVVINDETGDAQLYWTSAAGVTTLMYTYKMMDRSVDHSEITIGSFAFSKLNNAGTGTYAVDNACIYTDETQRPGYVAPSTVDIGDSEAEI